MLKHGLLILTALCVAPGSSATDTTPTEQVLAMVSQLAPAVMCFDDGYLTCHPQHTAESCTLEIKQFREQCTHAPITNQEDLGLAIVCLAMHQSGVDSLAALEAKCGPMNINLTQSMRKLQAADPQRVRMLLE